MSETGSTHHLSSINRSTQPARQRWAALLSEVNGDRSRRRLVTFPRGSRLSWDSATRFFAKKTRSFVEKWKRTSPIILGEKKDRLSPLDARAQGSPFFWTDRIDEWKNFHSSIPIKKPSMSWWVEVKSPRQLIDGSWIGIDEWNSITHRRVKPVPPITSAQSIAQLSRRARSEPRCYQKSMGIDPGGV